VQEEESHFLSYFLLRSFLAAFDTTIEVDSIKQAAAESRTTTQQEEPNIPKNEPIDNGETHNGMLGLARMSNSANE
jgi:hypothetical protein